MIDLRNLGLIGAIELEPRPGAARARAFETFLECFKRGLMIRVTGDTIALSPPLIVEKSRDRPHRRDASRGAADGFLTVMRELTIGSRFDA